LYHNLRPLANFVKTGSIPTVFVEWKFADYLGAWKARLGIGRMNYTVEPGLYAAGRPDNESPILVSASYKLTFEILRKNGS